MRKTVVLMALGSLALLGQPEIAPEKEAAMKADLAGQIDAMQKQAQVMVDSVFSFGELGFQEFETSKYLTGVLEKEGFRIERGVAGIPTAWVASWGSGKPVISLGSDIDDIPQASQNMLDILLHPGLVAKSWDYFKNVQTKDVQYKSFLRLDDKPAIWLNKETMEKFRPRMQKMYYDPSKYDTYLEQLGIKYPTVR